MVEHLLQTSEQEAEEIMRGLNADYRAGTLRIPDTDYDFLLSMLAQRFPDNAYFNQEAVESDLGAIAGKTVPLPARMLSTQKAYTTEAIEKWAADVVKAGTGMGIAERDIEFRITAKLDGFAAYLDNLNLYTRGDGRHGTDITRALERGLHVCTPDGYGPTTGPGEIVVDKVYFARKLSAAFENSRNIIAAVIKEGELDPLIAEAIARGGVAFMPFHVLYALPRTSRTLTLGLEYAWDHLTGGCPYDTDGLVIEVTNPEIKAAMGRTNHHNRWQIAYKKNQEYHNIKVTGIEWQTAKSGRITPVVQLEPTKVSGVTVSRATGHHAGNILANRIDAGAVVRVCRSGQVIPYIETVVTPATVALHPHNCPSCGADTLLDGDNLMCTNTSSCPAQIERTVEHFFKTIGNCDGFGPVIIAQLNATGFSTVEAIYKMSAEDFIAAIGTLGTAGNLIRELDASQTRPIEDWRFLAAFGIPGVGPAGCEKLLQHHGLRDVFYFTDEDFVRIDGIGEKTAANLVDALARIKPQFDALVGLFNLIETHRGQEAEGPIAGKTVVFSGALRSGSRTEMEKRAKELGAKVASSVSSKTDYLVCGDKVGANKTEAAAKNGVKVLTENEYLNLIGETEDA